MSGVIGISAGKFHTVYLKSDGKVLAAGMNWDGQLGSGTTDDSGNPVQVLNGNGTVFGDIVKISAGASHTVYLKSDGTVWAAGYNSNGQLGDGTTTNRSNPVQVMNSDGSVLNGVIEIFAGDDYSLFLKENGSVWSVGNNNEGQLGDGTFISKSNPVFDDERSFQSV